MSEAQLQSSETTRHAVERGETSKATAAASPSFLENFLNSFFQEKNIKWMLVLGAAIVFGSSLMLVTKNWPSWPNTLKYFTILGYTGVIFGAAEVSRKRLGLTSTYKVLHSLTLLLLPVCFLALQWLSAGSATQVWNAVEFCGLLLPAAAFLWFASSRILDHLLRGRQSTFLFSYCALSVAGAFPALSSPMFAFAFMAVCWVLMTAGVVKVNRHTFWLAEEHRLPRVFGFLPIAILGLQFAVLVGTKAITAIPMQWTGFGLVMTAATVLLTARTVADVFRQRTGNLVRPLPWNIVVPLLAGLVLTALGLTLSFHGFSYVSQTTYAVIPTSIVAAVLMFVAAKDTGHKGFVWAGLFCTTIAYQCCPTLFADIVQAMKETTATAINRQRVPFSLYGVTYLPLLGILALASRWFTNRKNETCASPCKHFVTIVAVFLFAISITDVVSLFFVSLANVCAFMFYAAVFKDRRYVLPSIAGVVIGCAVAIPALNDMQMTNIAAEWIPTVLAGLAALMTATQLPDRILNSIPLQSGAVLRHRDKHAELTNQSAIFQTSNGMDRGLVQIIGLVLAAVMAVHWIAFSVLHLTQPMTDASLFQYGFLMTAFVLYTLRNPKYLSGVFFWSMIGFTGFRWAAGQGVDLLEFLGPLSYITASASLASYLVLKWTGQISRSVSLQMLRMQLGFDATKGVLVEPTEPATGSGWARRLQAFVVPLCDLSLVALACLAAPVHLFLLTRIHIDAITGGQPVGALLPSTVVTCLWMVGAAVAFRSRLAGAAAAIALPFVGTAAALSIGMPITVAWCFVVWSVIEAVLLLCCTGKNDSNAATGLAAAIQKVSFTWLNAVLLLSCLSFAMPLRIAAVVCLGAFLLTENERLNKSGMTWLAIVANVQLLLLAGALGGYSGLVASVFAQAGGQVVLPTVFLTMAISVALFDKGHERLDDVICQTWTALLRAAMVVLAVLACQASTFSPMLLVAMTAGFVIAAVSEIVQAVRRQQEAYVWTACGSVAMASLFLFSHGVISFGVGMSQFVLLGISITSLVLAHQAETNRKLAVIQRPMNMIGQTLPTLVAAMAIIRQLGGMGTSVSALNALALMTAAGIYFQQAMVTRKRGFAFMAALIMNAGLMLLWQSLQWNALEFYLVPVGISILGFVELLKKELPGKAHDPLRYIGALTILVSPLFEVLDGSWSHMFVLMVLSTLVTLLAIGLRIRVLMYAGSAFLLADLVAMVIRSTMDHPSLLWVCGVALGAGVIAFAAFCENHRENLLTKIRLVSAELATWN